MNDLPGLRKWRPSISTRDRFFLVGIGMLCCGILALEIANPVRAIALAALAAGIVTLLFTFFVPRG